MLTSSQVWYVMLFVVVASAVVVTEASSVFVVVPASEPDVVEASWEVVVVLSCWTEVVVAVSMGAAAVVVSSFRVEAVVVGRSFGGVVKAVVDISITTTAEVDVVTSFSVLELVKSVLQLASSTGMIILPTQCNLHTLGEGTTAERR
jgi:hypothetical protein